MNTTFGWNYPPGVTGREYAIAGPDYEQEEHRECGAEGVDVRILDTDTYQTLQTALADVHYLVGWLDAMGRDPLHERAIAVAQNAADRLTAVVSASTIEVPVCPFAGETLVEGFDGVETWVCPMCGTEHEHVVDEGPDPDDLRDALMDRQ